MKDRSIEEGMSSSIHMVLRKFRKNLTAPDTGSRQVDCALHYIHAYIFDDRLTVGRMLEECHLHPGKLSTLFTYHVGSSPKQYINRIRIEAACTLNGTNGDKQMGIIAFSVGYRTQSAFTKAFKREVGVCPSEYFGLRGKGQKLKKYSMSNSRTNSSNDPS